MSHRNLTRIHARIDGGALLRRLRRAFYAEQIRANQQPSRSAWVKELRRAAINRARRRLMGIPRPTILRALSGLSKSEGRE